MRFSDDPEGFLAAHRISISAPALKVTSFVEVDVMGQYENLFDVTGSLWRTSSNSALIRLLTMKRMSLSRLDTGSSKTTIRSVVTPLSRIAAFEQMVKIEEGDEGTFAFRSRSFASIPSGRRST